MSNSLIRWNTARLIDKHLGGLEMLENFDKFSDDIYQKYQMLKRYHDSYHTTISSALKTGEAQLVSHLDKVMELQLFVVQNPDAPAETVSKLAKELFGVISNQYGTPLEITDGSAIDLNVYNTLQELIEFVSPVATLLNSVSFMADHTDISAEQETAIREYFKFKNIEL